VQFTVCVLCATTEYTSYDMRMTDRRTHIFAFSLSLELVMFMYKWVFCLQLGSGQDWRGQLALLLV